MKVTQKIIDGKVVDLAVYESGTSGCTRCMFINECTNPPVNRVMPCFSCDRQDKTSVYYTPLKEK